MREILFRGKRKDNDEWTCGYLVKWNSNMCIYFEEIDEFCQTGCYLDSVKVIPETVGQYTGLTDKNGTKIFEGDIVDVLIEDERGRIEWDKDTARFVIQMDGVTADFDNYYSNDLEVIDNIHDNPEL